MDLYYKKISYMNGLVDGVLDHEFKLVGVAGAAGKSAGLFIGGTGNMLVETNGLFICGMGYMLSFFSLP